MWPQPEPSKPSAAPAAGPLRAARAVRVTARRPGTGQAGGQHRVDQRRASRVRACGRIALNRLSHSTRGRARGRAAGGGAGRGTRVHHPVPRALGRGAGPTAAEPPARTAEERVSVQATTPKGPTPRVFQAERPVQQAAQVSIAQPLGRSPQKAIRNSSPAHGAAGRAPLRFSGTNTGAAHMARRWQVHHRSHSSCADLFRCSRPRPSRVVCP